MNLIYICEFVTLTQAGTFSEAAERLYLSQSALSKHIMSLEKTLGQALFVRSKKEKIRLTVFGQAFLPYALQISSIYHDMENELLHAGDSRFRQLIIGAAPDIPLYSVFSFLDSFTKQCPEFQLKIINGNRAKLYELLRSGQCNLIVVQDVQDIPEKEFHKTLYAADELSVLLPKSHPLASLSAVTLEQLKDENFIQIVDSTINTILKDLGSQAGLNIRERLTVTQPFAMVDLVENGIGIAMLPSLPAEHYSCGRTAVVPLAPAVSLMHYVLYPKGRTIPAATRALLEYIHVSETSFTDHVAAHTMNGNK